MGWEGEDDDMAPTLKDPCRLFGRKEFTLCKPLGHKTRHPVIQAREMVQSPGPQLHIVAQREGRWTTRELHDLRHVPSLSFIIGHVRTMPPPSQSN